MYVDPFLIGFMKVLPLTKMVWYMVWNMAKFSQMLFRNSMQEYVLSRKTEIKYQTNIAMT